MVMANSYVGTCPECGIYGDIYRFNYEGELHHACYECKQKILTPHQKECNEYIMGHCSHPDNPQVKTGYVRGQSVIKHCGECKRELCPYCNENGDDND